MDPQTILIGIAIFIISALVIYFIAAVTMREKTFEEVMAEQKKRQEEERERVKNDKKVEKELLKKKYKKGKGDKAKEKSAQVTEPELKDSPAKTKGGADRKMVNLEIEPEIIEPVETMVLSSAATTSSAVRNRKKDGEKKAKSILHNKDEHTPVAAETKELPHKPIKPLDSVELKKLHEEGKGKAAPQAEAKQEVKEAVREVKVQKVKATRVETMEVQPGASVEEKKASKSKASSVEGSPLKGRGLVDAVRAASLSEREVQTLIEILLNRQGSSGASTESWNMKFQKGDPMALMKKQLEEKERALQEEQQLAMAANTRVKELRNEVTAERTKTSGLEKLLQDKVAMHGGEVEALQGRLGQVHEQNMIAAAKMQARIQQLEKSGDAAVLQKFKQENRVLQETLAKASTESVPMSEVNNLRQKVSIVETELSNNTVKLNASENAKKSLEDKLRKAEEQVKKLESSKGGDGDGKKVEALQGDLKKAEGKNAGLATDLKKAQGAVSSAEAECASLKGKLQELEKHLVAADANKDVGAKLQESERKKQELEGNMKNLEKQLAEAVHSQDENAKSLKDFERKKQETESNNKNLEKQLSDANSRQEQTAAELQTLRQENASLTQEMKVTKEKAQTVQAPPAANGDIHAESKSVIAVTEHERLLAEKMTELTKLQSELEVQKTAAAQTTELKSQLDTQKQKNNELREKNWKAMEALEKAEKSAAEKVDKSLKSSRENVSKATSEVEKTNQEMLKRLFPSLNVSDKLSHKEWISSFEKQASQHMAQSNADKEKMIHLQEENSRLQSSSSSTDTSNQEVSRLQAEKDELQSRLSVKDNTIKEAEKKLHNLQQVVESEEKKWTEKLRQAEESIGQVSDSSREQELEDLTIQQQDQIEHYRKVLANTESVLRRLETEEKNWEEKLSSTQTELQQAKSDCQRLKGETVVNAGSTELQGKIVVLESELQESSEKLVLLTKEKEELTSKVIVLETQSKAVVQVDNEDIRKDLAEVQKEVGSERRKNKDLSSTLVRLNGIIKTGQDALTQEQKLVKQLQEQLQDKHKGSGGTASQEIEQLRSKLREKEKHLEREISANKQLSQRLGQLGVLGNSGNDGTSV